MGPPFAYEPRPGEEQDNRDQPDNANKPTDPTGARWLVELEFLQGLEVDAADRLADLDDGISQLVGDVYGPPPPRRLRSPLWWWRRCRHAGWAAG